jgi:hypothetical protein
MSWLSVVVEYSKRRVGVAPGYSLVSTSRALAFTGTNVSTDRNPQPMAVGMFGMPVSDAQKTYSELKLVVASIALFAYDAPSLTPDAADYRQCAPVSCSRSFVLERSAHFQGNS